MSARAAVRLERLGFARVYDYLTGKADWLAAGLPREGHAAEAPMAGDLVRPAQTIGTATEVGAARELLSSAGRSLIVVDEATGVVLGRVRERTLERARDGQAIEEVMELGPTTTRASTSPGDLAARMSNAGVDEILVTTPGGRPLGVLTLEDARRGAQQEG